LVKGLQEEILAGAGPDAFNSYEARKCILNCTIDNIKAFAADKPINLVR